MLICYHSQNLTSQYINCAKHTYRPETGEIGRGHLTDGGHCHALAWASDCDSQFGILLTTLVAKHTVSLHRPTVITVSVLVARHTGILQQINQHNTLVVL